MFKRPRRYCRVDPTFIPYVIYTMISLRQYRPVPDASEINGFIQARRSRIGGLFGKTIVLYYPVLFPRPTPEPRYRSRELYIFNPFKRLKATAAMTTARYI